MKKHVKKIIALTFILVIALSSTLLLTGCYEETYTISLSDGSGGNVGITYKYEEGSDKLEIVSISANGWDASTSEGTSYSKRPLENADLKFKKTKKCFQNTSIAMLNNNYAGTTGADIYGGLFSDGASAGTAGAAAVASVALQRANGSIKIFTNTTKARAPKCGDRIIFEIYDTTVPGHVPFYIDTTISRIIKN